MKRKSDSEMELMLEFPHPPFRDKGGARGGASNGFGISALLLLLVIPTCFCLMDSEQNYLESHQISQATPTPFQVTPATQRVGQGQCRTKAYLPYDWWERKIGHNLEKPKLNDNDGKIDSKKLHVDPKPVKVVPKQSENKKRVTKEASSQTEETKNEQVKEEEERYIVKAVPKERLVETDSNEPDNPEEPEEESDETVGDEDEGERNDTSDEEKEDNANKTEPDIPSFREWTQKALEEEQKKKEEEKRKKEVEKEKKKKQQNGQVQNTQTVSSSDGSNSSVPTPPKHPVVGSSINKNFASLDCGAKVVSANSESQGAGNIISPSRDEYMLNKCTDKAWFVVELCESIKALRVELANFELYSSVPKDFRVTMINTFPAREKDWALFGTYTAEDDRSIQSFAAQDANVFGKYARVEILSHHGTEHYCPISMFRIFGVSEIEMIGGEDDDDDDDDHASHLAALQRAIDLEDSIPGDDLSNHQPPAEETKPAVGIVKILNGIKELVTGVFRPSQHNINNVNMSTALNETSLIGNSFMFDVACPHVDGCDLDQYRDIYFLLTSNYEPLSEMVSRPHIRSTLVNGLCQSLGFNFSTTLEYCVSSQMMEFYKTLFGTSRTIALCNIIASEKRLLPMARAQTFGPLSSDTTQMATVDKSPNEDNTCDVNVGKEAEGGGGEGKEEKDTPVDTNVVDNTQDKSIPEAPKEQKETGESSSESQENKEPVSQKMTDPETPKSVDKENPEEPKKPSEEQETLQEPPPVVHVTPSSASHITTTTTDVKSGSVWQKLSNKIKTLERNVTLSSGYLEELSVRYKKQIEDLQLSVRQANEALVINAADREEDKQQIDKLTDELQGLTETVTELKSVMETIGIWAIGFHVVFLIVEVFIGLIFVYLCYSRVKTNSNLLRRFEALGAGNNNRFGERLILESRNNHVEVIKANGNVQSRRKSLEFSLPERPYCDWTPHPSTTSLTRRQRKRLQKKMKKVASTSRLGDIPYEDNASIKTNNSKSEESDTVIEFLHPSRFRIHPVDDVIKTENKFGLLNHSLHDDPTPIKEMSLAYVTNGLTNGHISGTEDESIYDSDRPLSRAKQKLRFNHRSKSTSPQRVREVTKRREYYEKFDPDKAEWMKKVN